MQKLVIAPLANRNVCFYRNCSNELPIKCQQKKTRHLPVARNDRQSCLFRKQNTELKYTTSICCVYCGAYLVYKRVNLFRCFSSICRCCHPSVFGCQLGFFPGRVELEFNCQKNVKQVSRIFSYNGANFDVIIKLRVLNQDYKSLF